ncbi:FAS1-like dehydratase domain-containing protein [Rhodococcus cercidiphylli]|uniref:MaoC family dehydratase N-terminal domain-containing protein n=1 Tax=Rhodococcus cercidiphylli TaxID=489916 RepID=A0ABU4AWE5_9NOCA|nr:MaoC family dehydratase N-terminal domain-containing protein [Rhodococcus cercidiphylli]MDV6230559.1 MaoC family dehydratase N-terminal domain-containing protein [Rhodococcus cercidiphylli]
MTLVSEAMRGAVGRTVTQRSSHPISESDIRKWALAVYWPAEPPRLYLDSDYAAGTVWSSIVAPEEFNPFAWSVAGSTPQADEAADIDANDPDRLEKALGIAGPGLKFQLNGGLVAEYGERMRPGDVITGTESLHEYRERDGKLGSMLFTTIEDLWTNQNGAVVKRTLMTLIRH